MGGESARLDGRVKPGHDEVGVRPGMTRWGSPGRGGESIDIEHCLDFGMILHVFELGPLIARQVPGCERRLDLPDFVIAFIGAGTAVAPSNAMARKENRNMVNDP
jgi:hypothetical protein